MNIQRLESLLARFPALTLLVVGDYFLDHYLEIDAALAETSLETGLKVHQVVRVRNAPGAAGTVPSNLRALGAKVVALGVIGEDGNGYELKRALAATGVDTAPLIESRERFTPTYIKPLRDGRELNRIDIKNRAPLPRAKKRGVPPTARNARTGELTPPGITRCAAANNSSLRDVMPPSLVITDRTCALRPRHQAPQTARILLQSRWRRHR